MMSAHSVLKRATNDEPATIDSLCDDLQSDLEAMATASPAEGVVIGARIRDTTERLRDTASALAVAPIGSSVELVARIKTLLRYLEMDCSCEGCLARVLLRTIAGVSRRAG